MSFFSTNVAAKYDKLAYDFNFNDLDGGPLNLDKYKGKVIIAKMDVSDNENIPANYGVRSIPHLALFKDGEVVETLHGAHPKQDMADMLDKHLA